MTAALLPRRCRPASPPSRAARSSAAFTLVEVTLAIGIVAVAFVAIFALIPVGMTNFRRSLDTALTTEIAQRLINDVKQSDFATVKDTYRTPQARYFTEQGDEVLSGSADTAPSGTPWLYYGEVSVAKNKSTESTSSDPDATPLPGAARASDNLLTIVVDLAANPSHQVKPFDPGKSKSIVAHRYTALVARNQ